MGFVDEQGQRALYVHPGVNDSIALEEISQNYISQATFLHLTSFVGDKSFQTQKSLLEFLPEKVKVSFDPGALYSCKGYSQLEPIINKTYVMMPNRSELVRITGEKNPKKGASFLIGKGVKIVAVKLGDEGCYITNGEEEHKVSAWKGPVIDTTGAGDAFCAGFLYGLLKEKSLLECGKIGNFVASRCVEKMGARAGLPYEKDLKLVG